EGRPEPALRITSRLEETSIVVDFMDNGCGIPEKDLERIYDPYFTTKFNGTGLGLMMVHRVIGEHGGMVGIRSREGEGTTVSITIPLSKRPMRYLPGMGEENRADTAENDITITEQDYETPNIDR
ncbi:MAG TPA: ATP-binding protein, partial [Candidatus Sumerlaeota bacterium]|nr:ATP-binding protein [Candidatus Sumerlaeota bacterium]